MCFRKHRPQLNPHSWWPRTKTKTKSSPCSVISSLSQRVGTLALKSRKGFFFPQMERAHGSYGNQNPVGIFKICGTFSVGLLLHFNKIPPNMNIAKQNIWASNSWLYHVESCCAGAITQQRCNPQLLIYNRPNAMMHALNMIFTQTTSALQATLLPINWSKDLFFRPVTC